MTKNLQQEEIKQKHGMNAVLVTLAVGAVVIVLSYFMFIFYM